jgi:hypothetical protein
MKHEQRIQKEVAVGPTFSVPSLLYNGHRISFLEVKRPGRDVNIHLHLSPRLKKK